MQAMIFDIQRNSFVDGPGIRTTVFFKGCNLRCKWCHNPEGISAKQEILFYTSRCIDCKQCVHLCPNGAISENMSTDVEKCDFCGRCESICPHDARKICGKSMSVHEVFDVIIKDKPFYDSSKGGATFSGGECMLQIDFLEQVLKLCKKNAIHTAVDTAGCVPWTYFEKVLPFTDLFLYDVKCIDENLHKEFTGQSNQPILENLKRLLHSFPEKVNIRIPVIPGFNVNENEIKKIADLLYNHNIKIDLLPYHRLGENKRIALNQTIFVSEQPEKKLMDRLNLLFNNSAIDR